MEIDHVNIHHLLELAFGFPYCSIKIVDMLSQIMIFITTKKPLAKSYFTLFTNTLICLGACRALQWPSHASIVVESCPNSMWNNE